MFVYYVAMGFAVLFLLSAAIEVLQVLFKGPSWKAVFTTAGSLLLAMICFVTGTAFH